MSRLDWEKAARRENERQRPEKPVIVWWWTPSRGGRCRDCGESMPKGTRIAYSHIEQTALCEICTDARGVNPTASRAWKAAA